jgi:hypothetical protein
VDLVVVVVWIWKGKKFERREMRAYVTCNRVWNGKRNETLQLTWSERNEFFFFQSVICLWRPQPSVSSSQRSGAWSRQ